MLLADFPKVLLRRWYATLAGLMLTAAILVASTLAFPAEQQLKSSLLLLPPASTVGTQGNPYLGLGGLKQPVDVLVRALSSQSANEAIAARWPDTTFVVEPDYATNGPILIVTVQDPNPRAALEATNYLLTEAPRTLDQLQASLGVRPTARITSTIVARDAVPVPVRKTQLRALVVGFGLGIGLTALAAALADKLALRRGTRPRQQRRWSSGQWPDIETETPVGSPRAVVWAGYEVESDELSTPATR